MPCECLGYFKCWKIRVKSNPESWPKWLTSRSHNARAHQTRARALAAAVCLEGKKQQARKIDTLLKTKIKYPLRTVLENSSRYGWETIFFICTHVRCRMESACEMQLLRGSKVSGEHNTVFMQMLCVNIGPRGLFALMSECLKPSESFVDSIFRLLRRQMCVIYPFKRFKCCVHEQTTLATRHC